MLEVHQNDAFVKCTTFYLFFTFHFKVSLLQCSYTLFTEKILINYIYLLLYMVRVGFLGLLACNYATCIVIIKVM